MFLFLDERLLLIACREFTSKNSDYDQDYHNNKLQTNPWHRDEEPHKNHETPESQLSKATSSLFPIKMIAKLEWT